MDKDQKDLPLPDPELPNPEKDLPLPEKEISAHSTPSKVKIKIKEKNPLWIVIIGGLILAIIIASIFAAFKLKNDMNQSKTQAITSFEECVAAGYPIMESYPEQCAANGQTFTRELTDEEIRNKKIEPIELWRRSMFESELGYIIKIPPDIEYTSNRFFIFGDKNRKDTADGFGPNLAIYSREAKSAQDAALAEFIDSEPILDPITINNAKGFNVISENIENDDFVYYLESENGKIVKIAFSTQDYSPDISEDSINKMKIYAEGMIESFRFRNEKENLDLNNWKSFENKTYKYTLQHPDYLNTYCKDGSDESCWLDGFFQGRGSENSITIEVVPVNEESRGTSFNSRYIDKMFSAEINESFTTSDDETRLDYWGYTRLPNTKVDGIDSYVFKEYKYIWESMPGTIRRTTIIPTENYYYVIYGFLESKDISLEQYNKILTTFQFTE